MGTEGREEVQIFPNSRASTQRQWAAAIAASVGIWATGTVLGWSSPIMPRLKETEDLGPVSAGAEKWIPSIAVLAALASCFIIGYTIEKIGRKTTSMVVCIPFVAGYAIMAAAQNLTMMYIGRVITGFCAGAYTVITGVYINEISQQRLKNPLGTVMVVCLCSGIAFVYIVGALVSWRWVNIICGIVPILHFVVMFFVPETPQFLLAKGRTEKASQALQWLRGAPSAQDVEPELRDIQAANDEATNEAASGGSIWTAANMKPCIMSVTAMAFQQLAGINAVIFYAKDIFAAAGTDISEDICSIIVGMTQAIGFAFAGPLVVRFGRRYLFFISEVGMCVSLVALGLFYYLKENQPETTSSLGWLPLVSLVMYMATYCVGVGPLPWLLMAELCPPNIKGVASAMTTSTNWGLGFVVAFGFKIVEDAITTQGAFWLFAGVCALGSLFALFILKETRGKTIEEVMKMFDSKA